MHCIRAWQVHPLPASGTHLQQLRLLRGRLQLGHLHHLQAGAHHKFPSSRDIGSTLVILDTPQRRIRQQSVHMLKHDGAGSR